KRTEWPHHARRQPCGYRLTIWPGFLILGPILAMRAQWPTQLFGLVQNMDVTTKLFYGLTGPRGQRSITSKLPSDHIVNEHRTKIQGDQGCCPDPLFFLVRSDFLITSDRPDRRHHHRHRTDASPAAGPRSPRGSVRLMACRLAP